MSDPQPTNDESFYRSALKLVRTTMLVAGLVASVWFVSVFSLGGMPRVRCGFLFFMSIISQSEHCYPDTGKDLLNA